MLVDQSSYTECCKKDICDTGLTTDIKCSVLEKYARECLHAGVCVEWRDKYGCVDKCPSGMEYRSCGIGCQETCENYLELRSDNTTCKIQNVAGCFCSNGRVLKQGECVETKYCHECDSEGHYPGDEWDTDKCTHCTCSEAGKLSCEKQACPESIVCDTNSDFIIVTGTEDDCCPKHMCGKFLLHLTHERVSG